MTEMLRLILEHDIKPDQVEKVRVGTNSNMPNALIHHRPIDELQAKFSMEFCIAILLLERRAGLAEFTDQIVNRPAVRKMIEKIEFVVDDEAERAGFHKMTTIIDITLEDGKKISGRADFGKGSPANPMSFDEVSAKFRECADFAGVARTRADDIAAMVRDLESLPNIRQLTALLLAPG
jgi:2-methylcitrate dehydratase PrpD